MRWGKASHALHWTLRKACGQSVSPVSNKKATTKRLVRCPLPSLLPIKGSPKQHGEEEH